MRYVRILIAIWAVAVMAVGASTFAEVPMESDLLLTSGYQPC